MESYKTDGPPWTVGMHALVHFDSLERLMCLGQAAIELELRDLHEAMDEDYAYFSSAHDEGDYLSHLNDEYIEVSEVLPNLFWYSQFLMTYSFFERALNSLCLAFSKQHNLSLSLRDIHGQGIFRAKVYLSKVCNTEAPFQLAEWELITCCAEIRNAIAHSDGCIQYRPDDKTSLYSKLTSREIEVRTEVAHQEDARIMLDRRSVTKAVKAYRVLLAEIAGLGRDFVTPKHGLPSKTKNGADPLCELPDIVLTESKLASR